MNKILQVLFGAGRTKTRGSAFLSLVVSVGLAAGLWNADDLEAAQRAAQGYREPARALYQVYNSMTPRQREHAHKAGFTLELLEDLAVGLKETDHFK